MGHACSQHVHEDSWEHFPHGADIGVRGRGHSREAAFEQAALALTGVLVDPALVRAVSAKEIACAEIDDELLLVAWLNALVYEMAVHHMIFGRFVVHIDRGRLQGQAWGEPVDAQRHRPAAEVKGATYTGIRVGQEPDGSWIAQCVVDV